VNLFEDPDGTFLVLADDKGWAVVHDRDTREGRLAEAGTYVQGGSEHSHRVWSSLLSSVAVRAAEVPLRPVPASALASVPS
jgi:hypothetical protein